VLRVPRPNTEEAEVLLGVVSRRYQPLQNVEAFEFFDPIVSGKKAYFETAGTLGGGERIWVMAKMSEAMQIVPGDECLKYLLLGAVARLVGIEGGVVSGVFNLESPGVEAPDWRPRHGKQYHEV
jgi:hypothetical protein